MRGMQNIRFLKLSLVLVPGLAMAAVPAIQSVTDSAGYGPRVAPGSIASLFGTGLARAGTASGVGISADHLAGGKFQRVSVRRRSGTAVLCEPRSRLIFGYRHPRRAATSDVVVNGPGGASASFSFTVTAEAPAMLSIWNQSGCRAERGRHAQQRFRPPASNAVPSSPYI